MFTQYDEYVWWCVWWRAVWICTSCDCISVYLVFSLLLFPLFFCHLVCNTLAFLFSGGGGSYYNVTFYTWLGTSRHHNRAFPSKAMLVHPVFVNKLTISIAAYRISPILIRLNSWPFPMFVVHSYICILLLPYTRYIVYICRFLIMFIILLRFIAVFSWNPAVLLLFVALCYYITLTYVIYLNLR